MFKLPERHTRSSLRLAKTAHHHLLTASSSVLNHVSSQPSNCDATTDKSKLQSSIPSHDEIIEFELLSSGVADEVTSNSDVLMNGFHSLESKEISIQASQHWNESRTRASQNKVSTSTSADILAPIGTIKKARTTRIRNSKVATTLSVSKKSGRQLGNRKEKRKSTMAIAKASPKAERASTETENSMLKIDKNLLKAKRIDELEQNPAECQSQSPSLSFRNASRLENSKRASNIRRHRGRNARRKTNVNTKDTTCFVCSELSSNANMVLCDACALGCHIYCMQPSRSSVPLGVWMCPACHTKAKKREIHLSQMLLIRDDPLEQ